jgi:uncharacterized protein
MSDAEPIVDEPVPPPLPVATVPVADAERAVLLDVLRGIALFGILTINIYLFAIPSWAMGLDNATFGPDRAVEFGITWLVQAKFYSLFSLLFGVGFAVQMRNEQRGDDGFTTRYLRRTLALFGFGLAHVVFLWEGDILILYSLVGLLLLAFRDVSDKALKRWIVGLIGIPFLLVLGLFLLIVLVRLMPGVDVEFSNVERKATADMVKETEKAIRIAQSSTYVQAMGHRLIQYLLYSIVMAMISPVILGMFLIGLLVGRRRIPQNPAEHRPLIRRTAIVGMTFGLLLGGFVAVATLFFPLITAIPALFFNNMLAGPLLGLGYAATITLIYMRTGPAVWTKPFAAAGRMPLTNYLSQSLICTLIFAGFAGGKIGQVSPRGLLGIAIAIYSGQLVISMIWLTVFRYGPMEWLWRTITYGTWQPMLRSTSA